MTDVRKTKKHGLTAFLFVGFYLGKPAVDIAGRPSSASGLAIGMAP
jgi:hypothetical protein